MVSLAFSASITGEETFSFVSGSRICSQKDPCNDGFFKSLYGMNGIWLKHMKQFRPGNRCRPAIVARIKKGQKHEYPEDIDPNVKGGVLSYLNDFKPLSEKPKQVTLAFEKPLIDLEKKIVDVRRMADETGLDFSDQIKSLEEKYQQALKDLYKHITPFQRLQIARHPNRPTSLDHILEMTDMWLELHGDRAGYDDPAIVTGIGKLDGKSYMFIAHQKGRNTKENIKRSFGMPTPHGYRKALRMMRFAEHRGFPIITLIDTPGASADLKSEELGQGEAIAFNLREMFGLTVPIITVVIGEGGSGGALAIGCANKLLMLQNAVFYVASPEACAAILWKSSQAAPKAAEKLKITAADLCELKICDGIISEPLGGAHTDPSWTSQQIKIAVIDAMKDLNAMDTETLLNHRHNKYRNIGGFTEAEFVEPERKRNMLKKEFGVSDATDEIELELENLKKMNDVLDKEMNDACISMGLQEKLEAFKLELSKSDQAVVSPGLNEKAKGLAQEFKQNLFRSNDSYIGLMKKLETKINWSNFTISEEAIARLSEELDKEMNDAFISVGMQEKLEAIKLELSKSVQAVVSPGLKEKADGLVQEFKQNVSRSNYIGLIKKIKTLNKVNYITANREKSERLEKEINEKLKGSKLDEKFEILKVARQIVTQGERLDDSQMNEVEMAKNDIVEMLKSLNLKFVGYGKRKVRTCPPNLKEKIAIIDETTLIEIDKAVNSSDLRGKIDELMEMIRNNNTANKEAVIALTKEIREGISAAMDLPELKKKIESRLTVEFPPSEEPSVLGTDR